MTPSRTPGQRSDRPGEDEALKELDFTSQTTVFQPGELGAAVRRTSERMPARNIAQTAAGVPSRPEPEAGNVAAIIKWPSGATIRIRAQLNIGRDRGFCACAAEMASELLVSRRHAVLEACADGVRVRDLGSRNGTFVDDEQVPSFGTVVVDRNALIRFGPHTVVQLKLLRMGSE